MSKGQPASFARALFLALLCAPTLSFACLWINGTTLDGLPHRYSPIMSIRYLQLAMDQTPGQRLEVLRSNRLYAAEKSSEKERQAVEAVLAGNPQAAVSLLTEIERTNPGQYSTAANLGTAYELAGDNQNALKWITEGIARNKDSHDGTEWLHQLILATKLRLATDPNYLVSHRIIPLPEKFGMGTRVKVGDSERSILEIAMAINYQLRERVVFVKPPDPIVADLLFTYAQIEAQTAVVESALQFLEKSREYGFAYPALLQQITRKYQSIILRGKIYLYTTISLAVAAVSIGLYFLYRKKWFFLTRADYLKQPPDRPPKRRGKRSSPPAGKR